MDNILTLKVKGMMCEGCENRVKNVLSEIEGVTSVEANHKDGTVIIEHDGNIELDIIRNEIEDLGYNIE